MIRYLPLVWKNLGRNKLRSLLTGTAIAFAVALVCVLRTMPSGLDTLLERLSTNTRVSVHNKAGLTYLMPYSYVQKVRALPGVIEATSWTWFGGMIDADKGVEFPNFAVDANTLGKVYADQGISPQALADFQRYRDGALVGRSTLIKQRWKVGDIVTLKSSVWPVDGVFRIVGEIPNDNDPRFFFHRTYLEQALLAQGRPFDVAGVIWLRVDDPDRVNPLMSKIDAMFRNSEAETASETEKSFFGNMFGNLRGFVTVILIVASLVTLCIVFIAANTASMSVRERVGELAVMKALGFRWRILFMTLMLEATLLASVAGAVGVLLSLGLSQLLKTLGGVNPSFGPLMGFVVTNAILVEGLFIAFFIGIVSGALPALGASRRPVATTLREAM